MLIITKARVGILVVDKSYDRGGIDDVITNVPFMLRPDQKAHKFYVTNLFLHKHFFHSTQARDKSHLDGPFLQKHEGG